MTATLDPNLTQRPLAITGTALIDLTDCGDTFDARYRLSGLTEAPNGITVVILVGNQTPGYEAVSILREHRQRLILDVWGPPRTVGKWIAALRAENGGWPT